MPRLGGWLSHHGERRSSPSRQTKLSLGTVPPALPAFAACYVPLRTDSWDGYSPPVHRASAFFQRALIGNSTQRNGGGWQVLQSWGPTVRVWGAINGLSALDRPSGAVAGPVCWLERRAMSATPLLWPAVFRPVFFLLRKVLQAGQAAYRHATQLCQRPEGARRTNQDTSRPPSRRPFRL